MSRALYTLTLGVIFGISALAQEAPVGDVFLGYSFVRANSARDIPAFTNNGGLGTLAFNINNHVAIESEFGGYHNGNISGKELDTTSVSFLFGPRFSYARSNRFDPYVHFLFGGMHISSSIAKSSVLIPVQPTVPSSVNSSGDRFAASQGNFAMAIGGGLDIKLSKYMTLRPIQLDYFMTRFEDLGLPAQLFGTPSQNRNQNNLRYAAGIAFNFGAQ